LCNTATATRFAYPRLSATQAAVFGALFPDKVEASKYAQGIIPVRVLQVMAFCKGFPQTSYLEIWHAHAVKEDPILIGRDTMYSGTNYLLARWGDALPTFDELQAKALPLVKASMELEIKKVHNKLSSYLAMVDNLAVAYLQTGGRPTFSAYD